MSPFMQESQAIASQVMYGASSPIFDVPEIPPFGRATKPLPKRRRTSDSVPIEDAEGMLSSAAMAEMTREELSAHVDSVAALHFMAIGGVQELFRNEQDNGTSTPIDLSSGGYGMGDFRGGPDEENGDGDYIDHLQQPGNTKKRKVPANMGAAAHGHDPGSASGEDEPTDRAIPTGRTDHEYDAIGAQASAPPIGGQGQRKSKLSRATLAGLQHKEMLKTRKRQLAAVLGALSHGDTLALDQALSSSYPFAQTGIGHDPNNPPKVRLSRRREPRLSRAHKAFRESLPLQISKVNQVTFPESPFTFSCHSATSDRLVATKEEVEALHARFEAELSRQAARAAEAAKQAAAALKGGPLSKRADRTKGRSASGVGQEQKGNNLDQSLLGTPPRGGKKKKRSALANASNPHHLRNYVPSRLPHTGQVNAAQAHANAQNLVSPIPIRFLSADVPPRRRSKSERSTTPISNLSNPADEWICPFCEYDLFYGDDHSFQRALRSRKKILRRRRRARERAAAAASGTAPTAPKSNATGDDDVHPGFEAPHEEVVSAAAKHQTRLKEERDRGGHGLPQGALG